MIVFHSEIIIKTNYVIAMMRQSQVKNLSVFVLLFLPVLQERKKQKHISTFELTKILTSTANIFLLK